MAYQFQAVCFRDPGHKAEMYTEHVIAKVQRVKVIGVYVLLLTCLLNLLVPCTAANSNGHYVVGVVAMG